MISPTANHSSVAVFGQSQGIFPNVHTAQELTANSQTHRQVGNDTRRQRNPS